MRRGLVAAAFMIACAQWAPAQMAANLGRAEWYRPPQLTVMMGFIKDVQHQRLTVKEWAFEIGAKFDAESMAGRAFLAAASEAYLGGTVPIVEEVWKDVKRAADLPCAGPPGQSYSRLRKVPETTILHMIDTPTLQEGPMNRYRPLYAKLAFNAKIFSFTRANVMPDGRVLGVLPDGDWLAVETVPDPELTIALEESRP